jgi:archaellum component FlaC
MSCKICGRSSCAESFHSFEEQELADLPIKDVIAKVESGYDEKIEKLEDRIYNLEYFVKSISEMKTPFCDGYNIATSLRKEAKELMEVIKNEKS